MTFIVQHFESHDHSHNSSSFHMKAMTYFFLSDNHKMSANLFVSLA